MNLYILYGYISHIEYMDLYNHKRRLARSNLTILRLLFTYSYNCVWY